MEDIEQIEIPSKSTLNTTKSTHYQLPGPQRNLDHLNYSENLYDFMKSLIPFSITTSRKTINKYLLNGDGGLEKNELLNVYYNDTVGKTQLLYELITSACLPKEWGQGDVPKEIAEG